ncbi:hypothetical protein C8Q70DRAFT_952693 [Cubamyces menziesii]|nr:hypothetical protein C8Q70DRAFT_952693 [Cubamyces menziesii]
MIHSCTPSEGRMCIVRRSPSIHRNSGENVHRSPQRWEYNTHRPPTKLYGFPIRDEEKAEGRVVEAVAKTVLGAHGDPQKGQLSICLCSDYDKDFTPVGAIVLQGGGMASQRDNLGDSAWAGRLLTSG